MVRALVPFPAHRTALAFDATWSSPFLSFDTPEDWSVERTDAIAIARRNEAVSVGRFVRSLRWSPNERVTLGQRSLPLYEALFDRRLEPPQRRCSNPQALVDRLPMLEPVVCPVVHTTRERTWVVCFHPVIVDEPFRMLLLPGGR